MSRPLASVLSPLLSLSLTVSAAQAAPPRQTDAAPPRPVVMTYLFPWYKYVAKLDGSIDPVRSQHFYETDPASGYSSYALIDDMPDNYRNDPSRPYKAAADWSDPAWYKMEFQDMADAGIDIAMVDAVTYLPFARFNGDPNFFGWHAVEAAAQAVREMQAVGQPTPKICMFWETAAFVDFNLTTGYDAASYSENAATGAYSHNAWGAWLQVREWFRKLGATNAERSQVWGAVDGRPVINVYCHLNQTFTGAFWTWLSDQFLGEFGVRPYIILDQSWSKGSDGAAVHPDAFGAWFASIQGPTCKADLLGGDRVVSLGPGYDSSKQYSRWADWWRLREDGARGTLNPSGNYYDYSWLRALTMKPRIVQIETWNERHEGTSISRTTEWGDAYIRQTAKYVKALREGTTIPATTVLNNPRYLRKRSLEGHELAGRRVLTYTAADDTSLSGVFVPFQQASTVTATHGGLYIERLYGNEGYVSYKKPYLYAEGGRVWSMIHVRVPDGWAYDLPDNLAFKLRLTYVDDRSVLPTDPSPTWADIFVQYDSWIPAPNPNDPAQAIAGPGNVAQDIDPNIGWPPTRVLDETGAQIALSTWGIIPLTGSAEAPKVRTIEWTLLRPRFGNRQNFGQDLRINIRVPARTTSTPLKIMAVELEAPSGVEIAKFGMNDVRRALAIASGSAAATPAERVRYDVCQRPGSLDMVNAPDLVGLLRKVAGIDANPWTP